MGNLLRFILILLIIFCRVFPGNLGNQKIDSKKKGKMDLKRLLGPRLKKKVILFLETVNLPEMGLDPNEAVSCIDSKGK